MLLSEATVPEGPVDIDEDESDVVAVARALASPTALAVLRHVEHAEGSLGVRELAERLGLHPNAVRKHLAHLRDAGLILEAVDHGGGAGRPRLLYRRSGRLPALGGWNPYEVLAELLVEVANGRSAHDVGVDYGRAVAAAAPEDEPIAVLAGVARRHGFEPTIERDGDQTRVVLGRCPFSPTATPDPVVCELHRGIVDGVAASSKAALVASLVTSPPHDGGCQVRIAPGERRLEAGEE